MWLGLFKGDGAPQPGKAAADDADIGLVVAVKGRGRRGMFGGERLGQPEGESGHDDSSIRLLVAPALGAIQQGAAQKELEQLDGSGGQQDQGGHGGGRGGIAGILHIEHGDGGEHAVA